MTEHSKEPWNPDDCAMVDDRTAYFVPAAHWKYAVECVNALNSHGLNPEHMGELMEAVERWHKAMKAQGHCSCTLPMRLVEAEEALVALLAKVKVKK